MHTSSADEFVEKAHALEEKAASSTNRTTSTPIKAGYFVIPIKANTSCTVVA